MAGDVLEEDSSRQLSLNVRPQRAQQLAARAQLPAEPGRVEPVQQPGIVVRGAAEHGAVGMVEVRLEEHTFEIQSITSNTCASFCLKKKIRSDKCIPSIDLLKSLQT